MKIEHPWIDDALDAEEMEAVLVATNELPDWDAGATMRAFQTYLWSNASAGGDQVSFVHDDSGVIICHDGNVVGIECGHGSLRDAIPDLISALYALGWRGAFVFSRAVLMQEVLEDIGRSIPAHLNFDVREAMRGVPVSDMPETQSLMDHSRDVLRAAAGRGSADGDDSSMDEQALAVLRSLDEPTASDAPVSISLADDDYEAEVVDDNNISLAASLNVAASLAPAISPATQSSRPLTFPRSGSLDDGDDAPRVFEFVADKDAAPHPADAGDALYEHAAVPAALPVPVTDSRTVEDTRNQEALGSPTKESRPPTMTLITRAPAPTKQQTTDAPRMAQTPFGELLQVGKSTFCFTNPSVIRPSDMPVSLIDEMGVAAGQVVHLWPGAVKQVVRWDVLGEIDLDHPLFAETWAHWAFADCKSAVQVADTVLRLRATPGAGLRDLRDQMTTDIAIQSALAALCLVPLGQAFVDVPATDEGAQEETPEVFTVREVMSCQVPRLFVVHVDTLDGAFVRWVITLLRRVIDGYSGSAWYLSQITTAPIGEQQDTALAPDIVLNEELTTMLSQLIAKLGEHGIDVATMTGHAKENAMALGVTESFAAKVD